MRVGVVVGGVVLMVIGLMLLSTLSVSWGRYEGGIYVFFPLALGGSMIFIGFVVLIAGLATSPPEKRRPRQPTRVLLVCPNCKARIPSTSKFCPECGADLRPSYGSTIYPVTYEEDVPEERESKRGTYTKILIAVLVALIMFFIIPYLFQILGG